MAVSKTFKTVALQGNQHLKLVPNLKNTMDEVFCEGYTDGKRDKALDAFYFRCDLKKAVPVVTKKEAKEPKAPKVTKQQEKIKCAMEEAPVIAVMKAADVPEINLDEIKTALLLKGSLSEGTIVGLVGYTAKVKEVQKNGVIVTVCFNDVPSTNALDTHFINF